MQLFLAIPSFATIAGVIVRILFSWVPFGVLQRIVSLVTGFPAPAAEPTTAFIKSQGGVRQALYVPSLRLCIIPTSNSSLGISRVTR